jgi:hypothetical protein
MASMQVLNEDHPNHSAVRVILRDQIKASAFWAIAERVRAPFRISKWEREGRAVPPPGVLKQRVVREYARRYGVRVLIETGTHDGEMDFNLKNQFTRIVTIELSPEYHARAVRRFARFPHIECLRGDSGTLLPSVLAQITEPCLFWLDAHYSAGRTAKGDVETPISTEVDAVLSHSVRNHVLLIDDARLFDGTHDYPMVASLQEKVFEVRPDMSFSVEDDIIRITPK